MKYRRRPVRCPWCGDGTGFRACSRCRAWGRQGKPDTETWVRIKAWQVIGSGFIHSLNEHDAALVHATVRVKYACDIDAASSGRASDKPSVDVEQVPAYNVPLWRAWFYSSYPTLYAHHAGSARLVSREVHRRHVEQVSGAGVHDEGIDLPLPAPRGMGGHEPYASPASRPAVEADAIEIREWRCVRSALDVEVLSRPIGEGVGGWQSE